MDTNEESEFQPSISNRTRRKSPVNSMNGIRQTK